MKKDLILVTSADYFLGAAMTFPLWNITSMLGLIFGILFMAASVIFHGFVSFTSGERIKKVLYK